MADRLSLSLFLIGQTILQEKPSYCNCAIYDLRCSPVTYDFAHFLGSACYYFSKFQDPSFTLIIVTDNCSQASSTPWEGYTKFINQESMRARVFRLLLPIASSFSQCRDNVKLLFPADLAGQLPQYKRIYPEQYRFTKPAAFSYQYAFEYILSTSYTPHIELPAIATSSLERILKTINIDPSLPFLTLTLRSYQFQQNRNTSPEEIEAISRLSIKYSLPVLVVPDTDSQPTQDQRMALDKTEFIMITEPASDLLLRLALYKNSLVNFMNLNGPMCLAILSQSCSYIMNFDATNKGNTGAQFSQKEYGIIPGSQPYKRFGVEVQWSSGSDSDMDAFLLSQIKSSNL